MRQQLLVVVHVGEVVDDLLEGLARIKLIMIDQVLSQSVGGAALDFGEGVSGAVEHEAPHAPDFAQEGLLLGQSHEDHGLPRLLVALYLAQKFVTLDAEHFSGVGFAEEAGGVGAVVGHDVLFSQELARANQRYFMYACWL